MFARLDDDQRRSHSPHGTKPLDSLQYYAFLKSQGEAEMDEINKIVGVPLVSVLLGAVITWIAAWWYYFKAGMELREEAARLRKASDLIIYCLANPNADFEPQYDDNGHVTGLAVKMSARIGGSGRAGSASNGSAANSSQ